MIGTRGASVLNSDSGVVRTEYSGFKELNAAVAGGLPWRSAVQRFASNPWPEISVFALGFRRQYNLCWLAGVTHFERALDIGSPFASTASSLSERFADVDLVEFDSERRQFASQRIAQEGIPNVEVRGKEHLASLRGQYDFVVVSDLDATCDATARGRVLELLVHCRRAIRSGGCVAIGMQNPSWYGRIRWRPQSKLSLRPGYRVIERMSSLLAEAGFASIHPYYSAPSIHHPRLILPATSSAVRAHYSMSSAPGLLNNLLFRFRLYGALYPSHLFLCHG